MEEGREGREKEQKAKKGIRRDFYVSACTYIYMCMSEHILYIFKHIYIHIHDYVCMHLFLKG